MKGKMVKALARVNLQTKLSIAVAAVFCSVAPAQAIVVVNSTDAATLANMLGGAGVTISNPQLTTATSTAAGTFSGGATSVGFDTGIVLTSGTTACVPGPNNQGSCTGGGTATSLKFDFTSTTGDLFFKYVFGSEEYNFFVGSQFNDKFELRLDGTNIANLPGSAGVVSINNVNCLTNPAFYRNNQNGEGNQPAGCVNLMLDTQLDGLTTVLTASALGVGTGTHTFEFFVTDIGDSSLDSAVFIQSGSFSAQPGPTQTELPEPATLALMGMGLAGLALRRRKR